MVCQFQLYICKLENCKRYFTQPMHLLDFLVEEPSQPRQVWLGGWNRLNAKMQGCVTVPEFFISDKISFPLVDRLKIKQMLQQLSHTHTNIKNMSVLSRRKHHIFSLNMWQLASSVSAKVNRTQIDLWMPTLLQVIIKKNTLAKTEKMRTCPWRWANIKMLSQSLHFVMEIIEPLKLLPNLFYLVAPNV